MRGKRFGIRFDTLGIIARNGTNDLVQQFFIDTDCNLSNVSPDAQYPKPLAMKLAGVALVYRIDPSQVPRGMGYRLLFGNWASAKWTGCIMGCTTIH